MFLYTLQKVFRVSCHRGVTEVHTLCVTSKKTAFKPFSGTHRIVLSLFQCPFLGQPQQSSETLKSPCHNRLNGLWHHRVFVINMCVWLQSLTFSVPLGKITLHPCEKANGKSGKTSRPIFKKIVRSLEVYDNQVDNQVGEKWCSWYYNVPVKQQERTHQPKPTDTNKKTHSLTAENLVHKGDIGNPLGKHCTRLIK